MKFLFQYQVWAFVENLASENFVVYGINYVACMNAYTLTIYNTPDFSMKYGSWNNRIYVETAS